jgi:hypothetical protein
MARRHNVLGVAVTGPGPYTYQWSRGDDWLPNPTTNPTYVIDNYGYGITEADNGVYTVGGATVPAPKSQLRLHRTRPGADHYQSTRPSPGHGRVCGVSFRWVRTGTCPTGIR